MSWEQGVSRAAGSALARLAGGLVEAQRLAALRDETRILLPTAVADRAFEELTGEQVQLVTRYVASPDFEQVAMQLTIAQQHKEGWHEELLSAAREQVRHGLHHTTGLPSDGLMRVTDAVVDALRAACLELGVASYRHGWTMPTAHLTAVAARNGRLLQRLTTLARVHETAGRLRAQMAVLHASMRLPHAGVSRSVPWGHLYVSPDFTVDGKTRFPFAQDWFNDPRRRIVILGDPGAGKSTLARKLVYDVASSVAADAINRVPFLVVLRDLAGALHKGDRRLIDHLIATCREHYNIDMQADDVEYLLLNDRAVVILDGLDELVDVSLRQRVTKLVEGFATLYPLTPVLVTSRRIGYGQAPLDPAVFNTVFIERFDTKQVKSYAANWFRLDDGTPPAERSRLCEAFLRESTAIEDLRANPLLLALLCATYSAEHYIPRNRAQVYERCAVMVFDRWDSLRGIQMPVQFHGRVRGAVQALAWKMFTTGGSTELPRSAISRILADYLQGKKFDEDEAAGLAEQFLDFCTGRAWVLAEVGSTDTEPLYSFAHRTFLEYFAAEYLVRRYSTADGVWAVLGPRVAANEWDVVPQLALQLLDRNSDDGAEKLLSLAIAHPPTAGVTGFLTQALAHVTLWPVTISTIVNAAIDLALDWPMQERVKLVVKDNDYLRLRETDGPLYSLFYQSLAPNLTYVQRAIATRLGVEADSGNDVAVLLMRNLHNHRDEDTERQDSWTELRRELLDQHAEAAAAVADRFPPGMSQAYVEDPYTVERVLAEHGAKPFYTWELVLSGPTIPVAIQIVTEPAIGGRGEARRAAEFLRDGLLRLPTPWFPARDFRRQPRPWQSDPAITYDDADLATFVIVCLPYLESGFSFPANAQIDALQQARKIKTRIYKPPPRWPEQVRDFIRAWTAGGISTIG